MVPQRHIAELIVDRAGQGIDVYYARAPRNSTMPYAVFFIDNDIQSQGFIAQGQRLRQMEVRWVIIGQETIKPADLHDTADNLADFWHDRQLESAHIKELTVLITEHPTTPNLVNLDQLVYVTGFSGIVRATLK